MSENDSLQEPYLATLDLNISEHLKLYNKEITGISESNRYDLTSSKWKDFYKKLEYAVSTFGFNAEVQFVTARDPGNVPTEFKKTILS